MGAPWHLYLMAAIYILAGTLHFVYPTMYERIIPPWIPAKKMAVYLSGAIEIALGAGLFFIELRTAAIFGIIALLILFLPVHTHMLRDERSAMGIPSWILLLRIPLQGLLIYWAYSYL
jgi:uncharacterized membrane protein